MLPLYLGTMGFGSVLIGVSLFFGGMDKDFDKDFDLDHDLDLDLEAEVDLDAEVEVDLDAEVEVDVDVEAVDFGDAVMAEMQSISSDNALADAIWLPIFSMRFWTFGTAAFGFTGTALTLGSITWQLVLLFALVFGSGMGTSAAYFFRALKKDLVSGTTNPKQYAGEEARAVLPIAPGSQGKILIETLAGHIELLATTRDKHKIPVGSTVLIAGVRNGVADVTALNDHTDEVVRRQRLTTKT